jgi:hypothetical protein
VLLGGDVHLVQLLPDPLRHDLLLHRAHGVHLAWSAWLGEGGRREGGGVGWGLYGSVFLMGRAGRRLETVDVEGLWPS